MGDESTQVKDECQSGEEPKVIFNDGVIENLSEGLLKHYRPHLEKTRDQLRELTEKQHVIIEQLHNENLKISWTQNSVDVIKMFDTFAMYQTKLNGIKKDIRAVHEKNLKLKRRAIRLQQFKEKMEYLQQQQKEMELKKETDQVAKSSGS